MAFVMICAAGWGLSPAAQQKILQLKEKYRRENGANGSTDYRETARLLREKLQKQADAGLRAEAVDNAVAVRAVAARKTETALPPAGEAPQTKEKPAAEAAPVGPQNESRAPALLAEKYDHMPAEPEPAGAAGPGAYSAQSGGTGSQKYGFGEFLGAFFALIFLASLTGNLAGLAGPSMGGGGAKEVLLLAGGGALLIAIGMLVVGILQNFMPFLAVLGFCMLLPKAIEKGLGEGLGCLVTIAIVFVALPLILGGNLGVLMVCFFLLFFFNGRR